MPQLLFQFQRNGGSMDGPFLETLMHVLDQQKITYDDIQKRGNDAVSVDFNSPEEAKNAFTTLDGMELQGSFLTIKPGKNDPNTPREQYSHKTHNENSNYPYEEYGKRDRQYNGRYNQRYHNSYFTNGSSPRYPPQAEQYPCRILIPSDMVKVVLGKSGTTITAIQAKTQTKIDVHRDKGPMRGRSSEDTLTTIRGEPNAFSDAITELLTVMQSEYEKRGAEEAKPLQLKLLAHDLLCGRIIGKAGNNLKQVRQDSGVTKLVISNSIYEEGHHFLPPGAACTGERVITIEGTAEAISLAEQVLSKKLRDYMEKDMKNTGNSGMNNMAPGSFYGPQMNNYYSYPAAQMMYQRPQYGYPNQIAYMGFPAYPGYMNQGYPGILGHGYPPFTQNLTPQPQGSNEVGSTCILIPTKEVGAVIGRNGDYISRLKGYSGAQVRVVKGEDGGESRVEITGPPDAQWRASLCVFSKIKETMKLAYSEAQLKTEYMVPGSCVGRIIGKKGQVVQDIQDKAQADIEVPKDKQGGDDVPVFITGTFNGTQIALNRIRDIVHRAQTSKDT